MSKRKYIIIHHLYDEPILFGEAISHADIARKFPNHTIVSAGFFI